ncbi:MAG: ATP-dependent protease, partial [Alphaproteobacteria bacterium]|nr:ATP-dependent protease [Alphaproteobacteria bacterium]
MLREDVVAAAERGEFHIYPITTIDEGIEQMTGVAAGEVGDDGTYPPDSVNGRVQARLQAFAQAVKNFTKSDGDGDGESEEEESDD